MMRRRSGKARWISLLAFAMACGTVPAAAAVPPGVTLATEDTSVRVETRANRVVLRSLKCLKTGWDWSVPQAGGDEALAIPFIETAQSEGRTFSLDWRFVGSSILEGLPRRYVLSFACADPPLELKSIWQARPGPGPIEHSITIRNRGTAPVYLPLQTCLVFETRPPADHTLESWWVEKGANTPTAAGTHHTQVAANYAASLVSLPYAREGAVERDPIPWTATEDLEGKQGWYAGIEFSGRVRIALRALPPPGGGTSAGADSQGQNHGVGLRADLGLDPDESAPLTYRTRVAPGDTFETPTVFVGCYAGDVDDGANRLHRWVESALRPPVHDPHYPLLVSNTWGSGMAVNEALARKMIENAADLGLEMFHLDAGWFQGVGDWHPNPDKFPNGLAPIADYAHTKGLKFGLWVGWTQGGAQRDPSGKQAMLSVFDPQMKPWFTHDYPATWKPSDFTGADVCLGAPQATEWCLNELRRIVQEYKLDMLEHDQRIVVDTCDRDTHLHTDAPSDIAYHAARGYYHIYDTLRLQYPGLLFEDCVNGGHMVDYGAVQRTHYISITDTYDPLSNRRAFYDASYALPPSLCECYIESQTDKTLGNFIARLRSGMMGWCTLMCDTSVWSAEQRAAAKRQFEVYKTWLRPLIVQGNLYHVSDRPDGVRWDGMEYADPQTGKGVLFAFRGTTPAASYTFPLKGLDPSAPYRVSFEGDTQAPFLRSGDDLMQHGLTVQLPDPQTSALVYLQRQ